MTEETNQNERTFIVYLGNFNPDVELKALDLNGLALTVSEAEATGFLVTDVQHQNGTHAYVLVVHFDAPIVQKKFVLPGIMQYTLKINYTLNIVPQNDPYYHPASIVAQSEIRVCSIGVISAMCKQKSIFFQVSRMGYMREVCVGPDPLTPELAAHRGYILKNSTNALFLEVPFNVIGYVSKEISLQSFFGTFALTVRDVRTLRVEYVNAKRCRFDPDETVVCMPDGVITVVASVAPTVPVIDPLGTSLLDRSCSPSDTSDTTVLFTFNVTTCGTRFRMDGTYLIYENEVVFNRLLLPERAPVVTRDSDYRLTVRCSYSVNDTRSLSVSRVSVLHSAGIGSIFKTYPLKGLKRSRAVPSTHSGNMRGKAAFQKADFPPLQPEEDWGTSPVPVLGLAIAFLGVFLLASVTVTVYF
nr:PREDICTED: zona pellucida sperm-binding protein 2-like isoform X2 [Lepisosteus oculatus]